MTKQKKFIPGIGWDTPSIVTGYIKTRGFYSTQKNIQAINSFRFDEVYPFTNIFWGSSPASYESPVIGFAGSYKQIEEDWAEWLWKFSQLLSGIDAVSARVNLDCVVGSYTWLLQPEYFLKNKKSDRSMIGEVWGITEAPEEDFSVNEEWLNHFNSGWNKFVERWPKRES